MVSDKIIHKAFRINKTLLYHVFHAKVIREMFYITIYQNYFGFKRKETLGAPFRELQCEGWTEPVWFISCYFCHLHKSLVKCHQIIFLFQLRFRRSNSGAIWHEEWGFFTPTYLGRSHTLIRHWVIVLFWYGY